MRLLNSSSSSSSLLLFFSLLLLLQSKVEAHSRWKCPKPRSKSTGIKDGPCGSRYMNDFNVPEDEDIIEIQPGLHRIVFEESIHHTGSPFRISLSGDGSDEYNDVCVILDHIPHNDCCRPNDNDPTTYTQYVITINIPNVICDRCSLHLSNPMTDKIGLDGTPTGIGCSDPNGTCQSVYHSCTMPFRILGNSTDGAVPRSDYVCPSVNDYNKDWPTYKWIGDDDVVVNTTIPGIYRRESSVWNTTGDFTLTTAPKQYREDASSGNLLCSSSSSIHDDKTVDGADDEGETENDNTSSSSGYCHFHWTTVCYYNTRQLCIIVLLSSLIMMISM